MLCDDRNGSFFCRVSFSNPLQLEPKVTYGLPAIFPIFGEASADGVIQGRRGQGLNGAESAGDPSRGLRKPR